MDNKTKKTGRLRRFALRALGATISKMVIYRLLRKKISKEPALLPGGLSRCSEILFILPANQTEMIYQLENLFSILGKYRESNLTFVCPASSSPFVSGLKDVKVLKFDPVEFQLFSAEFNRVTDWLSAKTFDLCVLLEKDHTLAHLYLVGMSRAHLRVGWDVGSGNSFPFLNIRLFSIPRDGVTLWERNLEVAKILDAAADPKVRWGVPKSTAEEVAQILRDHKLKKDPALICIDAANLEAECGKAWCAELIKNLKGAVSGQFYIFGGTLTEAAAAAMDVTTAAETDTNSPFPVLPPTTIPKTAALMACTDLVITGAGPLLGLAQISTCKIVPVVTQEQASLYCKPSDRIAQVIRHGEPGSAEVSAVLKNTKALLGKVSKTAPA
ncbi:MAG: hypothetical protein FWB85_10800 [Chitinispirillia bacterium]|nr:hypothetical protein [Chitinispirillia bacterium]MCL2242669.1 hypothetical protein [Chitinispirillia bacterium]